MSKDYPNRQDWLAIRETSRTAKRKTHGRYIHVSGYGRSARRSMPIGAPVGVTYNVGRNARKRQACASAKSDEHG